jgi:hypothetical protein
MGDDFKPGGWNFDDPQWHHDGAGFEVWQEADGSWTCEAFGRTWVGRRAVDVKADVGEELRKRAEAVDASDEARLAAGWRQQVARTQDEMDALDDLAVTPCGPAGHWRLHASGVWVRWVCQ